MVWTTVVLVVLGLAGLDIWFYYKVCGGGRQCCQVRCVSVSVLVFTPSHPPRRCPQGDLLHFTLPSAVTNELHRIPTVDTSSARAVISYIVPSSLDLSAQQAQQAYRILAYIFSVIAVVVFVITLALRRSIATAVAVIKIGADALRSLPTLVCFPLTTVVGLGLFLVWWVFVAASLATATGGPTVGQLTADAEAGLAYLHAHAADYNISASTFAVLANASTLNATITQYTVRSRCPRRGTWGGGDRVPPCHTSPHVHPPPVHPLGTQDLNATPYLLVYHFFGLLWTTQFIVGLASMAIAGAVCAWYFGKNEARGRGGGGRD